MHYEILPSLTAEHQELTTKQKHSPFFSEAPRIGSKTLRRGTKITFEEVGFKHNQVQIKRLFDAHAIEVFRVDEKGRFDLRDKSDVPGVVHPDSKLVEKAAAPEAVEIHEEAKAIGPQDQTPTEPTPIVPEPSQPQEATPVEPLVTEKKEEPEVPPFEERKTPIETLKGPGETYSDRKGKRGKRQ